MRPDEIGSLAVSGALEVSCSENCVLLVVVDRNKMSVRGMSDSLEIEIGVSEFFGVRDLDDLSVFGGVTLGEADCLQVGVLKFQVFAPDDFTVTASNREIKIGKDIICGFFIFFAIKYL